MVAQIATYFLQPRQVYFPGHNSEALYSHDSTEDINPLQSDSLLQHSHKRLVLLNTIYIE